MIRKRDHRRAVRVFAGIRYKIFCVGVFLMKDFIKDFIIRSRILRFRLAILIRSTREALRAGSRDRRLVRGLRGAGSRSYRLECVKVI